MTQAYRQKVGKGKENEENDEMVKQVREASWNQNIGKCHCELEVEWLYPMRVDLLCQVAICKRL